MAGSWTLEPVDSVPGQEATPSGWNLQPVENIPGETAVQPGESQPSFFDSMLKSLTSTPLAAAQGTSPIVASDGKYNYEKLGSLINSDAGPAFADQAGNWKLVDPKQQVVLPDPATGQLAVFARNPEMAEGKISSLGHMVATGALPENLPIVGAEAALNPSQQLLRDFETVGVPPNIPAVGQGIGSRLATNIASKLPGIGGPIARGAQSTIDAETQAAQNLANLYGSAHDAEEAGTSLRRGIQNFVSGTAPSGMTADDIIASPTRASSFKAKSNALYDRFWSQMNSDQPIPIDNTMTALKGPAERFPSSPELGAQITNPKLQSYFNSIQNSGGQLTAGELGELRSHIGRMLGEPMLVSDIPRADLKNVYAGISSDLENAAQDTSPAALRAFQNANNYYKSGLARIDQLEPLLSGSPEQSFAKINKAAGETGSANAGLLRSAKRSMTPDDWNDVGAAIIRRLGEPSAATKDISHGADFSANAFAANWNKLSPSAKDTIFGANDPGSNRETLEALARVANAQKNVAKFANPSGTASHVIGGMGAMAALEYREELLAHPWLTSGAILGGYGTAKALMSPGMARWLYQAPAMISGAPTKAQGIARAMGALDSIAKADPTIAPIAARLSNAFGAQQNQGQ